MLYFVNGQFDWPAFSIGGFFKDVGEGLAVTATVVGGAIAAPYTAGSSAGLGIGAAGVEAKLFWGGSSKKSTSGPAPAPVSFWDQYKGMILCAGAGILVLYFLIARR